MKGDNGSSAGLLQDLAHIAIEYTCFWAVLMKFCIETLLGPHVQEHPTARVSFQNLPKMAQSMSECKENIALQMLV